VVESQTSSFRATPRCTPLPEVSQSEQDDSTAWKIGSDDVIATHSKYYICIMSKTLQSSPLFLIANDAWPSLTSIVKSSELSPPLRVLQF
jgi:hypothetical protein